MRLQQSNPRGPYGDMRIKKLEIVGFKSFAERARLQFGEGITGVVGPNGCGKSNIVDAIRWCMGEMSAKHLRGRAMQDVIFAGSDSHGPQGMAEVTLTFDNDGNVPNSYLNYAEIAVTRRLFRDGTSDYLLNKTPVRLRDVTDLFLGTGVGTRAYSIIEQGRVGFVVNSRPEDRRGLIEDVAGITKFKARKKAAERRMEATEQNLLRVNDVVAELERQLGSLRRQAKKAARYRELRDAQRDLELHLAALDVLRLTALQKVQHAALQKAAGALAAAQQGMLSDESGLDATRQSLLEQERGLQAYQQTSAALDADLAALDRDLQHWRRAVEQAQERSGDSAGEVAAAMQRIDQAQAERVVLEAEGATLAAQMAADSSTAAQVQAGTQDQQERLAALDEELETRRRDALQHVQGAAQQRTLAANLERQHEELEQRLRRTATEREQLQIRQAQAQTRHAALIGQRDGLRAELASFGDKVAAWRGALPQLHASCKESGGALRHCQETLRTRRSRLASLEEIARRLDGYSDGVRTLLGTKKQGQPIEGLSSLVTQILEVPPTYERAIEAALGDKLQYLLVDHSAGAQAAIAHLKAKRGGRSGFIPHNHLPSERAARPVPVMPGVEGPALALIAVAPEHADVATYLLGDVLLVDTLEHALAVQAAGEGWLCVSREGDVVEACGVVSGGSSNGAGLLANRREIRELLQRVAQLETELQAAQCAHDAVEAQRLQLEINIAQLDKDIHSSELEERGLAKDCQAAAAELQRVDSRLLALQQDAATWGADLERLRGAAQTAVAAALAAEAGHQETECRLAELQERRQVEGTQLAQRADELTAVKVRLAARQEKLAAAQSAMQRLDGAVFDLRGRIQRAEHVMATSREQMAQLAVNIAQATEQMAQKNAVAQARHVELQAARARYELECGTLAGLEAALKEQRRGSEALHETIVASKLELQRLELEMQQMADHVLERHDLPLAAIVGDYHLRPLPDGAARQRVAELERAIRALGSINLTAIDECAEVEARFVFLVRQRDDLQAALDALRRAIGRINRASRERFRAAFDAVNEMFQKVYPRLFRGGVARLELTESDDLLEAGVDIIAMPPGKKLQNVGLLSGGEKALTATALVFSIFLIKPSPFCILDEVDAPLDEANVGRFNEMLREISKVSQFIVITHNKQTMLQADRLYGVTMEEPGRSKIVAVDLQNARKEQAA